ncbi:MAG: LamG domain-containing protein [Lentisphaerae bacterium]|nr:LamG domain-containing protein [Lentisphaerota bacterium]
MNMWKKALFMLALAAGTSLAAAENEELLYFSFDEGVTPDVSAAGSSCTGHVAATENEGGFAGEAIHIKSGIVTGHSGMEMQFRALTLNPGLNHNADQGAIEFYFAPMITPENQEKMVKYTDAKGAVRRKIIIDRIIEICHYDEFSQADKRFTIGYGNTHVRGVSGGSKWRLIFEEVWKKEKRAYKGLEWNDGKILERRIIHFDTGKWEADKWHHVIFSWQGGKRTLYIDGVKVKENDSTVINALIPQAHSTIIGGRAPFQHHQPGTEFKVDELKFHSTAIAPEKKEQ